MCTKFVHKKSERKREEHDRGEAVIDEREELGERKRIECFSKRQQTETETERALAREREQERHTQRER